MTEHHQKQALGIGYDTPDFSYLQHVTPPRPQAFEGDTHVSELSTNGGVEILPRLGPEDGFVVSPSGKLRSIGVAPGTEALSAPTGSFKATGNGQAEQRPVPAHEAIPGTVALQETVEPTGRVYRSWSEPRHRRQPRHRA